MRAQAYGIHFLGAFVADVGVQHLFGEVALQQKPILAREILQRIVQRAWHRGRLRQFLRTEAMIVLMRIRQAAEQ